MLKGITCLTFALLVCAAPAFANVTVSSPYSGAEVVSPFSLVAKASPCDSQRIDAMGYSLDDSTNTTIFNATSINTMVSGPLGAHILHVKSWGHRGSVCVTNVAIDIVPDPAPTPTNPTPSVPTDALAFNAIQDLTTWTDINDTGSGGSSSGTMALVSSPSLSGSARKFATQFTNYGGELYYTTIGSNTSVSNFLYDGWVYIANSASSIANIEMDMNQVMANGQTVIYGFQCDGWTGTWDYTENAGSPSQPEDEWVHSQAPCNPQSWSVNTWHHVQVSYSRDQYGNVTYQSVWLDGVEQDMYATVPSAFALGWSSVLLTNFQIDGYTTSGSSTVYLDNLTVYAW
jgi:hypothetical protein